MTFNHFLSLLLYFCRNCIGQQFSMCEIKVIAAQTLKNFRLSLDENSPKLLTNNEFGMTRSNNGIYIKFTPL